MPPNQEPGKCTKVCLEIVTSSKVLACPLMLYLLCSKTQGCINFLPAVRGGDRQYTTLVGNLTKGDEAAKTAELAK